MAVLEGCPRRKIALIEMRNIVVVIVQIQLRSSIRALTLRTSVDVAMFDSIMSREGEKYAAWGSDGPH